MVAASQATDGWTSEPLGKLGRWLSGGTPSMANPDYWGGDIPWVSPKDMKHTRLWDTIDHVTERALGNGARLAPAHALLLVVRGMILAHTFPVARAELSLAFNQDIKALVPRDDVDSDYLLWWLIAHERVLLGITTESTHGTKRMPTDALHGVEINLPPLPEQRAIAAALSDVDALLGGLERLIAKKRDLKQAATQQLLTGQTRLPGFTCNWESRRVAEMGDALAGKALNVHGLGALRPYLRTKNVLDGRIDLEDVLQMPMTDTEFNRFRIEHGDVLLNEGQSIELVGRCSMYRDELGSRCAMQNQLLRFRAHAGTSPAFAEHLFRRCQHSGVFATIATQTTSVAHLGSSRFSDLRLSWPIDPNEQGAIAAALSDMDAELSVLEARRDKTRAIKQGMMQELLTGRTPLVPTGVANA
jgi:restriction endonuclease S subunit